MKLLYLDCGMGAAGDMLTASLLGLLPEEERSRALKELNDAGIPGVRFELEKTARCGIQGLSVHVRIDGREEGEESGHGHGHGNEHEHGHGHDHEHEHAHEHGYEQMNGHSREDGHAYIHEHEHEHGHDHGHGHDHDHEHGYDHEHEHGHDHTHTHSHVHHSMHDIRELIGTLKMPEKVKADALAVYELIAAAEGEVHGMPVAEVHFHEVGMMDAVADVTACAYLVGVLKPDRILASPVAVGSGTVRCAHGILPVPAPATANLLRGIPTYAGEMKAELCTPTGAALLKHFADGFGEQPAMTAEAVGYGMGKREFERANCVRAILGGSFGDGGSSEMVCQLSCNLDDMTPEEIGHAAGILLEEGALDVWTLSAGMKKSRPGVILELLCTAGKRDALTACLFRNTTTLGVREQQVTRRTLKRRTVTDETEFGTIRKKVSSGFGVERCKFEYEDLAAAAGAGGISLLELKRRLAGQK